MELMFSLFDLSANVCVCVRMHMFIFFFHAGCVFCLYVCVAGEDAANDPVQIVDVYPPAVL